MKTIGIILFSTMLLTACASRNSANKDNQPTTAPEATATVTPDASSSFLPTELTYPGSNISFRINVEGKTLVIQPAGLSITNEAFKHDITGYTVTGAEIGDLNTDGYPEIFVYLTSDGSGSYGQLIGYSVNNGKSASQVYLPDVAENSEINQGYMGHDQMAIVENCFCQRFPIYNEEDSNATPTTAKTRQIQYKLVDGESCRILQVDKVMEF